MIQVNLFTRQNQTPRHRKQTYVIKRDGGMNGEVNWEVGINIYTLLKI